ncbi:Crp/Fnr family transcriptional regulator [Paenibacillus doosanensis]|uniref:Regulatory protein YeiL n=1 Tax=Paenibacillus konkukensis TaxID=2020716 RepID=A0ABY4RXS2_9BACL|nr:MULTISPECIES: Crp/Fnr family transcriptional regulator [Paenibacillus]MCS7460250.1 Crp/Fnr family transcriptional regulator [Paenibacillus doosanensis]UQZ86204.1 Regulatory protein YeiL [Paenibacillus konkukensis]
MKVYTEHHKLQPYMSKFDLSQIFIDPPSVTIQLREYERGESVLAEGDELDGLYFQVEGLTKVSSSVETGKSLLLRFCRPLSIFGDIELIQKVAVQSRVEAVEASRFLYIDKRTVERKLMREHRFLNELLKHLAYKLQTCTTASRINLLASVEERLAIYLLTTRFPNEFGKEIQTPHIPEIASVIGTTPRHLNRVIHKLHALGILQKARKSFEVLDWEQLDTISNGLRYD